MRTKIGGVLVGLGYVSGLIFGLPGSAQGKPEIELLSKADAIRLFRLTKQQWLQEVRTAVASGQAVPTGGDPHMPGMTTTTVDGDIITVRLDYSKGDRKPLFVQVVIGYRPPRAKLFTDSTVKEALAEAKRQMAPEFEVVGSAERIEGGLAFFFELLEKGR
jgi:hypothetical protein